MAASEPSAYVYFLAKVGVRRQTAQGTGRCLQSIEVSCNNSDSINGFEKGRYHHDVPREVAISKIPQMDWGESVVITWREPLSQNRYFMKRFKVTSDWLSYAKMIL